MRKRLVAVAMVACLAACSGLNSQRVAADRATFDWFAPMMRAYLQSDPRLDDAAKATHMRGLEAWDARIRADEEQLGVALPMPGGE